jgi:SAM-dependent methyltransferase
MHASFTEYLVDPVTKEELTLQIDRAEGDRVITGSFRSSTALYPIVRGVPRFVNHTQKNYADSFGYQWNKWARIQFEHENVGKPMAGHTTNMWERITDCRGQLEGKLVLDIGCGPGRFTDVARRKGARAIAIDYSSAVEAAAEIFTNDDGVCICQADALRLPIRSSAIDLAFSIGVLHHTPDPKTGVQEAVRTLVPAGQFAISVYGKGGYYDFPTVYAWRRLFSMLWPVFKHYPPLIYSYATAYGLRPLAKIPVLGKAIQVVIPFVRLPDIHWSVLDTFDSVTPSYQSAHESYEIFQWLRSAKLSEVEPTNWGFTAFKGTRI